MNNASIVPAGLPALDAATDQHRLAVETHLLQQIHATGTGFMPFEQWMDLALYAPGLAYYAAGSVKFGGTLPVGDFATAPELTPLFSQIQIGRAHVCTPGTNAHLVCRLLIEKHNLYSSDIHIQLTH